MRAFFVVLSVLVLAGCLTAETGSKKVEEVLSLPKETGYVEDLLTEDLVPKDPLTEEPLPKEPLPTAEQTKALPWQETAASDKNTESLSGADINAAPLAVENMPIPDRVIKSRLKGMRGFEGREFKIVVGEGYTRGNGSYVVLLRLFDINGTLVDEQFFAVGDDESKFVDDSGDRILRNEFLVREISKRIEGGKEVYIVKIV